MHDVIGTWMLRSAVNKDQRQWSPLSPLPSPLKQSSKVLPTVSWLQDRQALPVWCQLPSQHKTESKVTDLHFHTSDKNVFYKKITISQFNSMTATLVKSKDVSKNSQIIFSNWQVLKAMELSRTKLSRTGCKRLCICYRSPLWTFLSIGNNSYFQRKWKKRKLLRNIVQNMNNRYSADFIIIVKFWANSVLIALLCHTKIIPEVLSAKLKKTGAYIFQPRCQQVGSNMDVRGTGWKRFLMRPVRSF